MADKDIEPIDVPVDDELAKLIAETELTADDLSPEAIFSATDPSVSDVPVVLQAIGTSAPKPMRYFQTFPDEKLWPKVDLVVDESDTDNSFYVIPPKILPAIPQELLRKATLVPFTTLEKRLGLWPIKHAKDVSKRSMWEVTAFDVCQKAKNQWVRKINAGSHWDIAVGKQTDEPWWPENFSVEMIYDLGLKQNLVTSFHHPIVSRARGLS